MTSLNLEYLFARFYEYITGDFEFSIEQFAYIWDAYVTFAVYLSLVLLAIIVYSHIRIRQIRKWEMEEVFVPYQDQEDGAPHEHENTRWQQVTQLLESDNPNDWRRAILEADVVLDELLMRIGYAGESVGEKLKQADSSRIRSLESAWEAHKMRNKLAHGTLEHELTHRQARETVARFQEVLEEFNFI